LDRANEFAKSIMLDLEDIPGRNGMQVMWDIIDRETRIKRNIILRSFIDPFWGDCSKFLNDPLRQPRLCVVGTSGIGKTTGTAFPIRKLLEDNQTVVYRIRGEDPIGWYHYFFPKGDGFVAVNVYPETNHLPKFKVLHLTQHILLLTLERLRKAASLEPHLRQSI
jgi:hypothetical protein